MVNPFYKLCLLVSSLNPTERYTSVSSDSICYVLFTSCQPDLRPASLMLPCQAELAHTLSQPGTDQILSASVTTGDV